MRRTLLTVALSTIAIGVSACGGGDAESGGSNGGPSGEITVLAASSLTEAFTDLEKTFEAQHDVDVKISFDSSSVLAEQAVQGAPADVLATADERTMGTVVDEGLTDGDPKTFAENILTIATPPDNPANVASLRDLESDDVTFAVCVPEAPCGNATQELFDLNDIDAEAATQEQNVKSVLTKVALGEVDAGMVYVSDAKAAGEDVDTVDAKMASQVVNPYPIAVLSDAAAPELAQEWVELVRGEEGQQVLKSYGFQPGA